MFLTLTDLLIRRSSSAAPRRYPTELNVHIGHPIYLTNEKQERVAIACAIGADTRVCPYTDLQPALKKKTVGLGGVNRALLRGGALAFTLVLPTGAVAMAQSPQDPPVQLADAGNLSKAGKEDRMEGSKANDRVKDGKSNAELTEEMRQMRQLIELLEARISQLEAEKSAATVKHTQPAAGAQNPTAAASIVTPAPEQTGAPSDSPKVF